MFDPRSSGEVVRELAADPALAGVRLLSLGPHPDAVDLWAEAAAEDDELAPVPVAAGDPCSISWTGGTTGRSKGVLRSQRAIACMNMLMLSEYDWPRDVRYVVVGPLSHAAGSIVPSVLMRGGTVIVRPRFDVEDLLASIATHRATVAFLVPTMLYRLLDHLRTHPDADVSGLELVIYGASPISEQTLRRAIEVFGCDFLQGYGMTETTAAATYLFPADHRRALAGEPHLLLSAGRPLLGTELRIVDEHDRPLPLGSIGEVAVRGPQLMRGYWNLPEQSAEALRGGWLHTGDIGAFDADGYLTLMDRSKDLIISGGSNIYPREVEEVLLRHAAVREVSVIGRPDREWGEVVVAYVVGEAPPAELDALCLGAIARFKRPKDYVFVDTLPKNNYGKVLKTELRASDQARRPRTAGG